MTIKDQAMESWGKFVDFHMANPSDYWLNCNWEPEYQMYYVEGWQAGFASRMAIGYDPDVTDDNLWDEGEAAASRTGPTTEARCKFYAAGFSGGYKNW